MHIWSVVLLVYPEQWLGVSVRSNHLLSKALLAYNTLYTRQQLLFFYVHWSYIYLVSQ